MQIFYDEAEDILMLQFNKEPIAKDVSLSWNVHLGMTARGVGQISVLDAKADGFLPIKLPAALIKGTYNRSAKRA